MCIYRRTYIRRATEFGNENRSKNLSLRLSSAFCRVLVTETSLCTRVQYVSTSEVSKNGDLRQFILFEQLFHHLMYWLLRIPQKLLVCLYVQSRAFFPYHRNQSSTESIKMY